MHLYRVVPHDPRARRGRPGHPSYVFPGQTLGRWDNAASYALWYASRTAAGAVGEVFGDLATWSESMFLAPYLPTARRALAVVEVPDDLNILDLDDPLVLAALGIKPSQVVGRNPAATQDLALRVFRETTAGGERRWAGLSWWSFHRPFWTNVALWAAPGETLPLTVVEVQPLSCGHDAIIESAAALAKKLP